MAIEIILKEYYNLICEISYLQFLSNGLFEDNESAQFVKEKILLIGYK